MEAQGINLINHLFGLGTIAFEALALFILIGIVSKDKGTVFSWIAKNALFLVFLVSFAGMAGSLVYSQLVGFAPCMLCWYQRIAMYPIAILSLIAIFKKYSLEIWSYLLTLSIIGTLIALWHVFEQSVGKEIVSCGVSSPSCLQQLVKVFGYIDIPVMSLSLFILVILLILNKRRFA